MCNAKYTSNRIPLNELIPFCLQNVQNRKKKEKLSSYRLNQLLLVVSSNDTNNIFDLLWKR
jgi:hypothetical protein